MSWLSSLTDVAKNAEALLNSVDAKAKEVAVVTNQVGALPNQAAEVGSETTRSGGVGAGRPYAKHETRNMASASEGGVGERREVPADRPAGRGGAPRTPRTKKSLSSGSSLANGHAKAKAKAVAVEEKSFDDLAAALSSSLEDRNAKDTSPARDPRLLSPVSKAGVTAPKAGEKVQEKEPNAFPSPPETAPVDETPEEPVAVLPEPPAVVLDRPAPMAGGEEEELATPPPEADRSEAPAAPEEATAVAAAVTAVEEEKEKEEEKEEGVAVRGGAGVGVEGAAKEQQEEEAAAPAHAIATVSDARAEMRKKLDREIREAEDLARSKPAAGTALAKEARLSAMCERLSSRLQQYKAENEQLEGLLSLAEKDKERAEGAAASMEEHRRALEGKEMEISELTRRLAEAKKQEERLDREVGELAKERDEMAKKASSSEIRVMSAAQEELEAAEARVESERRAHRLTKDAALRREQDLEAAAAANASELAGLQRRLEAQAERVANLDAANAALEQEAARAERERGEWEQKERLLDEKDRRLQEAQRRARDLERDLEQRDESSSKEAEEARAKVAELQAQLEATARARGEEGDAKQKLSEMTDLLYSKQEQLEKVSSSAAATQLTLESTIKALKRDLQLQQQQSKRKGFDIEDGGVVPMDYDKLAKNKKVGNFLKSGAQALDFSTSTVVGMLKKFPLVRLGLFTYIISVHFFLYWVMYKSL